VTEEGTKRVLLPTQWFILTAGRSLFYRLTDQADPFSRRFFAKTLNKNFKTKFEFSFPSL
jgi:hypothetical protein